MATDWIMVRIDRRTHDLLKRLAASMQLAYERGQLDLYHDDQSRISINQVVTDLAYARLAHQRRARESSQRRRKRGHHAETSQDVAELAAAGGGGIGSNARGTKQTLGPILRQLRQLCPVAMSRGALSLASGVSVETIRSIEDGRRLDPSWSTVQALADALGVSTEELRTDGEGYI